MAEIIRKTLLVSIIIWFTTIANLVLLAAYHGNEHGWLCFLTCMLTFLLAPFRQFIVIFYFRWRDVVVWSFDTSASVFIPSSDNEHSLFDISTLLPWCQSSPYLLTPFLSPSISTSNKINRLDWHYIKSLLPHLSPRPPNQPRDTKQAKLQQQRNQLQRPVTRHSSPWKPPKLWISITSKLLNTPPWLRHTVWTSSCVGHGVRWRVEFSTSAWELRVGGFYGPGRDFGLEGRGGEGRGG